MSEYWHIAKWLGAIGALFGLVMWTADPGYLTVVQWVLMCATGHSLLGLLIWWVCSWGMR